MDKHTIAKEVYKHIEAAIVKIEEEYEISCKIPPFIEVDGERFYYQGPYRIPKEECNIWTI